MDWQLVIDRNHKALVAIIVALMGSVGLAGGGALTTLPYFLYRKAHLILRQAESALRRLIVIAAHQMKLPAIAPRKPGKPRMSVTDPVRKNRLPEARLPVFTLLDPFKDPFKIFWREAPDFARFGSADGDDCEPFDRKLIPAAALGRRLLALRHALDTIPEHAKRLARWYAIRDLARAQNKPHHFSPMRPGPPPGSRRKKRTEMDALLTECHLMAMYARNRHDSS
jgi:hypothetical protein